MSPKLERRASVVWPFLWGNLTPLRLRAIISAIYLRDGLVESRWAGDSGIVCRVGLLVQVEAPSFLAAR
jgi:hypothetical protein